MGVGRNWVMGVSVVISSGAGNIMRVKETGGFLRFFAMAEFAGR